MNQSRPNILIVVSNNDSLYDPKAKTMHRTGTYLDEFGHFYNQAMLAGARLVVASPQAGVAPIDPGSLNLAADPHDQELAPIKDRLIQSLMQTSPLDRLSPNQFDAVMIPGGHALLGDLPNNKQLAYILRGIISRQRYIAAVCHGPAAFIGTTGADGRYLVEGLQMTGFSAKEEAAIGLDEMVANAIGQQLEDRLRNMGAIYSFNAENFAEFVVPTVEELKASGSQIITGQNPHSARETAIRLFQTLSSL